MNKYMEEAINMAENNAKLNFTEGGPFGAVIVKDGVIVGRGKNCVLLDNDPTAHAEVKAIRDACKTLNTFDLTGCELYTSCYPCPMCLSAIIWSNITKVYYGNTKEDAANIGFRDDMIYDFIKSIGTDKELKEILNLNSIDREFTMDTFKKFDNQKDKTIY